METEINVQKKPDLEDPILIEGLPGIGNVGRIAAAYVMEQLGAEKFAELYSPHFMPFVLIEDDEISSLKIEFYSWKNDSGNDIVFLVGNTQAREDGGAGHFEIAEEVIEFCKDLGIKRVFTLGGFATGSLQEDMDDEDVEVLGAVTHKKLKEKYSGSNINFEDTKSNIGMIVGATGVLLGTAKKEGLEGVCLMGETTGFPILTDPKAAESIIKILIDILDLDITLDEIDNKVEEMEEFLDKLEKIQKKAMKKRQRDEEGEEELKYIG